MFVPEDVKLPPAGTGDSSTTFFDTSAIKAEAKAYAPSAPAASAVAPPTPSTNAPTFKDALAAPEKPAVGEQAQGVVDAIDGAPATPPAGEVLDIPDTQLVRLKIDGVEKILPYGEAKTQMMLRQHYTKEMQSLRAKEEQVEAKLGQLSDLEAQAQRAGHYETLLTDQSALAQYIEKAFPGQFSPAQKAEAAAQLANGQQPTALAPQGGKLPTDLVDFSDATSLVAAKTSQLEQEFGRKLTAIEAKIVERAEGLFSNVDQVVDNRLKAIARAQKVASFDTQITSKINELLQAHPHVGAVDPDIGDLIRHRVAQMKPKSPEEMFQAIEHIVVGASQSITEKLTNARVVETREKLSTHGVAPPNGTPIALPVKDTFQKADGSWDWDGLKSQARQFTQR